MKTLTVQRSTMRRTGANDSEVRMRGQWLVQAGFSAGQRIEVRNPSPGIIELRTIAGPELFCIRNLKFYDYKSKTIPGQNDQAFDHPG